MPLTAREPCASVLTARNTGQAKQLRQTGALGKQADGERMSGPSLVVGSQAEPGTIRGDFGVSNSFNLIHGSDSPESAQREVGLFFGPGEILDHDRAIDGWVYDLSGAEPE